MKNNKKRLFEVMSKIDPSFKLKLNEDVTIGDLYLSDSDLNKIMEGYIEAALWTEEERLNDEMGMNDTTANDGDDYDDYDNESQEEIKFMKIMKDNFEKKSIESFTREDIDPDSLIQAYLDIKKFIIAAGSDAISEALNDNNKFQLGMDLWLTRNHHGAGFFDHFYDNEKKLTNAAHNLKEVDLYIGDDGKLYFS